jgi:putative membrane protein
MSIAIWLACPHFAWADASTGVRVTPETVWRSWNWDLLILFNLALLALGYGFGWHTLRQRTSGESTARIGQGQLIAFCLALAALLVALISPLHALSEELATAHMVQHMLLMVVAAPLFVYGSPGRVLVWSLDEHWRRGVARGMRSFRLPLLDRAIWPWLLYAAALWFWHWPPAYEAALADPLLHDAQHLSFFGAACVYWRGVVDPFVRRRLSPLVAVFSLFATSLQSMLLGIFLALSPRIWYEGYRWRTEAWNLSLLEDQQLSGLVMWMPACLVYPALAALVLGRWLQSTTDAARDRQILQEV